MGNTRATILICSKKPRLYQYETSGLKLEGLKNCGGKKKTIILKGLKYAADLNLTFKYNQVYLLAKNYTHPENLIQHHDMINVFHEELIDSHLLSFVLNSPIYKKSDIENCDFIVYEKVLREKRTIKPTLKSLSKKYKHINRFIIVFIINDDEKAYRSYDNIIVVRTSLKASKRKDKELVLPFIWDCLDQAYPPIDLKNDMPTVGFCGLNSKYRKKLIKVFSASPAVKADFILRKKFWGGSPHDAQVIKEFNDNIKDNVFIISQRGAGNYSMRFYQTLAAGRIPVLVNTNMTLPFENKIDWNDLIVFEKDEAACLKKVVDVFKSGKYIQMQNDCAKLFSSYFSDTTFFSHLADEILTYKDVLVEDNKR